MAEEVVKGGPRTMLFEVVAAERPQFVSGTGREHGWWDEQLDSAGVGPVWAGAVGMQPRPSAMQDQNCGLIERVNPIAMPTRMKTDLCVHKPLLTRNELGSKLRLHRNTMTICTAKTLGSMMHALRKNLSAELSRKPHVG